MRVAHDISQPGCLRHTLRSAAETKHFSAPAHAPASISIPPIAATSSQKGAFGVHRCARCCTSLEDCERKSLYLKALSLARHVHTGWQVVVGVSVGGFCALSSIGRVTRCVARANALSETDRKCWFYCGHPALKVARRCSANDGNQTLGFWKAICERGC